MTVCGSKNKQNENSLVREMDPGINTHLPHQMCSETRKKQKLDFLWFGFDISHVQTQSNNVYVLL